MYKFKSGKFAILTLLLTAGAAIFFHSCKHVNGDCKSMEGDSSGDGEESHNMGKNCLQCHRSGGEGEGCFTLGGTVYDSLQNNVKTGGTMKLYTGPNGTGNMVLSLPVDDMGNFYTGKSINFIGGLYPAVTNKNGVTKYMSSSIPVGSCNNCHGVSTAKIWTP